MGPRPARERRREAPAATGITGPAELDGDGEEATRRAFRERMGTVREAVAGTAVGLRRVFALVWAASPRLTAGLAAATIVSGVIPAASAYTSKLLINAVLQAIVIHQRHEPDRAVLAIPFPGFEYRSPATSTVGVIVAVALIQLVLFALTSLLGSVRNITQQLLQERVSMQIQLMVMQHAATLDLQFFEDPKSYDLLRRAQTDSANRPVAMISGAFGLLQTAITFATMVALLVVVSPLLALVALVSPIPAFISDARYGWRGYAIARWSSTLRRRMQYLISLVTTDTFAKEVKLFHLAPYFLERYRLLAQTYYERQRGLVARRYLIGYAWGVLTTIAGSATYLYVALQAVAGRLTLGDLTLYTAAAQSVQGSIQGILGGFSGMYEHNLYLSNLYELLETEPRVEASGGRPLPRPVRGEIRFDHVSFAYPGARGEALRDLNFTVSAGETVAVVGRNGAGKTTLVKLLARLYDPDGGRILLDGVDIRELELEDLRSVIGAMFQDFVTYQATASENIGLGSLDHLEDRDAIAAAADRGGATELIDRLPKRFDTVLGKWFDEGANLSGGEWQKIALARAFMRDARVLILDEPTSALDAQAEHELFERLRSLSSGRTAVYISHRFSTVRRADRILFLEQGRLVEEGTHPELMRLGGRYAALFNLQASAYVDGIPIPEQNRPAAAAGGGDPPAPR